MVCACDHPHLNMAQESPNLTRAAAAIERVGVSVKQLDFSATDYHGWYWLVSGLTHLKLPLILGLGVRLNRLTD
jgi:hypothetical protein